MVEARCMWPCTMKVSKVQNKCGSLQTHLELPEASEGDVGDIDDCEKGEDQPC